VDEDDFLKAARRSNDRDAQLIWACKEGAARELYEETGMDIRSHLDRLEPAKLRSEETNDDEKLLTNELKERLFFFLHTTDKDFVTESDKDFATTTAPLRVAFSNLRLKLSHEHSGFTFEADPSKAADMLEHHSGGKCAKALRMAMSNSGDKTESGNKAPVSPDVKVESSAAQSKTDSIDGPEQITSTHIEHTDKDVVSAAVVVQPKSETVEEVEARSTEPAPNASHDASAPRALEFPSGTDIQHFETLDSSEYSGQDLDVFPKPKKKGFLCCFGYE